MRRMIEGLSIDTEIAVVVLFGALWGMSAISYLLLV
jgi:hypothetical protein